MMTKDHQHDEDMNTALEILNGFVRQSAGPGEKGFTRDQFDVMCPLGAQVGCIIGVEQFGCIVASAIGALPGVLRAMGWKIVKS